MKKLLSLLSVLTISGTAVPTTIAVSPYQKQEKLNNKINYQQINNLESLKRNKRQSGRILDIDENLIINEDEKENYKSSMEKIISLLINNNIFISVFESSENEHGVIYELNRNVNYDYFTVPVSIIQRDDTRNINLVFRIRDLYLQGFIININNTRHYYHFTREVQDDLISYPNINSENTHDLGYIGHYNTLMGQRDQSIYWQTIASSFFEISNMGTRFESQRSVIQAALGRIVLITSESLRFRSIYNLIINNIINNDSDGPIYWNPEENSGQTNIRSIVTNWQSISNNIIDAINNIQARFENNNRSINEWFYNLLSQLPTDTIAQALANTDIRVILGLLMQPVLNCDRRRARSINNDIKNEYCDAIKGQEQNYPLKNKNITTIKILDENTKGNNLSKLDMYIGTNEGLYFKKYNSNLFVKVDNVDDKIVTITTHKNGNHYTVTDKEEIYFIRTDKFSSHGSLIGEQIFNAKSSNLEKEIKLYYYNNESPKEVTHNWYNESNIYKNKLVMTFKLGKLNPVDYFNKIEFLGNSNHFKNSRVSWGNEEYNSNYNLNHFNGFNLKNYIKNKKASNSSESFIPDYFNIILQPYATRWWGSAWIDIYQGVGITFYWENNNWYLQLHTSQYGNSGGSSSGGSCFIRLGSGIRLYN